MSRSTVVALAVALATPIVGLALLLAAPSADPHWDHQPSHFWLVAGAAAIAAVLGWSVGVSARRRSDARLFLVSLSFLSASAFLGLHALATPRVLIPGANTGFVLAVPTGLVIGGACAMWSAISLDGARARWVMGHSGLLRLVLLAAVVIWVTVSLAELPPLDDPTPVESGSAFMITLGVPTALMFATAAWRYLSFARERRAGLLVAIAAAWVLLAEAAIAVSFTESWRISWWVWHILMVVAFGAIAYASWRLPEYERFSDLYLDEVVGGTREVTILFADLQGFTAFSEAHTPEEVRSMLNTYFEAVLPDIRMAGGRLDRFLGDAVMVTFNASVDQPDHAVRAARAALGFQASARQVAERHPDWPRFRTGINTGPAVVGVIGDGEERGYTVLGDTVNVASHIESLAPVGSIAISDATRRAVPGAQVTSLGAVALKTRSEQLEIWRLDGIDSESAH
ncbi:MAG: adenylate/guanylate cyclase domain-containing protein [Ilumatobacteraceae bacterium]